MKEIYSNVMQAIATKAPEVKWIDFNMGQYREAPPPVDWPCALIDLAQGEEYTPLSGTASIGTVTVEVSVGFRMYERTHNAANTLYRNQALEHIDTVEKVRAAIERTAGDTFSPLEFRGFEREQRADYRIWTLRFACTHTTGTGSGSGPGTPVNPYQPWPGPGTGPGFCAHPNIE